MAKKTENKNEIVERVFFVKSVAGKLYYAGRSVLMDNGRDTLLTIGNETFIGFYPKVKPEGEVEV